jgi:peptidoglycan hydrolase-like protein with peptidoglycan-binding domain
MPKLTASVGIAPAGNRKHDIALIQTMLRVVINTKTKKAYYPFTIDGTAGKGTNSAINDFQLAFSLAAKGTPAAGADKLGIIAPDGPSFKKLVELAITVNADFDDLRVLPDTKMVYLAMSDKDLADKLKLIDDSNLEDSFKKDVRALIQAMFDTHRIALAGWQKLSYRRSFADQHKVFAAGTSNAGPGESNHQFGRALDVGYVGLRYLRMADASVTIVKSDVTFDQELTTDQITALYEARNVIWERPPKGKGTLFRIRLHGKDKDPNHYQAFNEMEGMYPDPLVSTPRSLADFLSKVSGMKWETMSVQGAAHMHYACDLGLGGDKIDVGMADEIWTGNATLTKAKYLTLLNAARIKQQPPAPKLTEAPAAEFEAAFKSIKEAFVTADNRYKEWEPHDSSGKPV